MQSLVGCLVHHNVKLKLVGTLCVSRNEKLMPKGNRRVRVYRYLKRFLEGDGEVVVRNMTHQVSPTTRAEAGPSRVRLRRDLPSHVVPASQYLVFYPTTTTTMNSNACFIPGTCWVQNRVSMGLLSTHEPIFVGDLTQQI